MSFDPTKPFQTRDGRKARIIATDRDYGEYSIVALVYGQDNHEYVYDYTKEGLHSIGYVTDDDLINVPARHVHADIIIAWANGAKIQEYSYSMDRWEYVDRPRWSEGRSYRIMQEN